MLSISSSIFVSSGRRLFVPSVRSSFKFLPPVNLTRKSSQSFDGFNLLFGSSL
ncbi:MAG: hypothetical protein ACTS40_00930 [Candidatus Hodgkinia cicadicola]